MFFHKTTDSYQNILNAKVYYL